MHTYRGNLVELPHDLELLLKQLYGFFVISLRLCQYFVVVAYLVVEVPYLVYNFRFEGVGVSEIVG